MWGKKQKPFYKRGWFLFLLIIAAIVLYSTISKKNAERKEHASEYKWPDSKLAAMLPKPDSQYGRISSESERSFSIDIYQTTEKQFEDYVDACKECGFSVDYSRLDGYYSADNETGHSLMINYNEESREMGISLYAPSDQKAGEEDVSGSGTGEADDTGRAGNGAEQSEDMTQQSGGAAEGESQGDGNSEPPEEGEGDQLGGADGEQQENGSNAEGTESSTPAGGGELVDGMRPEFKEAMDSYEAFYDEYCELLKEYSENPTDLSLLTKYTEFLAKLEDVEEKFEAWDDGEMNYTELQYYTEVNMRILQKLSGVGTEE